MLLIGSLRLDALGGFIDGEPAEFVGFRPEDGDSGRGVSCEAVRVGCTYPMIGAAGWLGSVLIDQQCQAFPLVPLLRRLSFSAYCFDSAVGVGHGGADHRDSSRSPVVGSFGERMFLSRFRLAPQKAMGLVSREL